MQPPTSTCKLMSVRSLARVGPGGAFWPVAALAYGGFMSVVTFLVGYFYVVFSLSVSVFDIVPTK